MAEYLLARKRPHVQLGDPTVWFVGTLAASFSVPYVVVTVGGSPETVSSVITMVGIAFAVLSILRMLDGRYIDVVYVLALAATCMVVAAGTTAFRFQPWDSGMPQLVYTLGNEGMKLGLGILIIVLMIQHLLTKYPVPTDVE